MKETYKEILAKKYARESNYTIIIPTDTLEELESLWNKFLTTMTIRQQRLCDDRSLQIYGMTNLQHYEQLKAEFEKNKPEEKPEKKITPDESESIVSDKNTGEFTTDMDSDFEGLIIEEDTSTETGFSSGIYVIPDIVGKTPQEQLEDLEQHYNKYMSLSVDKRRLSDDGERMMYGLSNQERYDRIKGELLASIDTSKSGKVAELKPDRGDDKAAVVDEMFHDTNTFVGQHFLQSLEESKKTEKKKKSRFNNTPYFTPTELIDMGVHGNDNYYSKIADNDGLTKDISVTTWFDSYKEMISQHVYEDYTAEWIKTLDRLYSDFDKIKECGTEEEVLARKQSILDLGWNPEIDFSPENRIKAAARINKYMDEYAPEDVFIDMDEIVPNNLPDTLEEAVSSTTHKPVFVVLTKGKTPIISSSIQKVTKSEYSHASISFDPDLKELYSYNFRKENLGFVMEKLSTIKNTVITVWCFFTENEIVERMKRKVYDFKTHDTHYDFRMLPRFIVKKDIKPGDNEYNQICSTFVDTILKAGNINLVRDITMPSPADIYDGIKMRSNVIFKVFDGPASQYDGSKVKKKVNYLISKDDTEALNEACKDVETARKFIREVDKIAKKYDANYFIVTDGASKVSNQGNAAVKHARDAQIEWEKENGYDPDEDWSKKKAVNEGIGDLGSAESNDIYHNIEDWDNGKSNILFVTGLSGSGKSTLSKELSEVDGAVYIEMDLIQRYKFGKWDGKGCEPIMGYINFIGGVDNLFSYVNEPLKNGEKIRFSDFVDHPGYAPEIDRFLYFIIDYAKKNRNKRFIVEGMQLFYHAPEARIKKLSKYPIILKMNGPFKTEFRREKRNVEHRMAEGQNFFNIVKRVFLQNSDWVKNGFYMDDWKQLKGFRSGIGESFITEAINDLKNGVNPYGRKTFYHISFDPDLDEKTLTPRVPDWIVGMKEKDKDFEKKLEKFKTEVNPDGYGYEDPKTPRICFSNSIEGCLNAIINPNKRLHLAGKQIYVFVPEKPISEYKTRSNKTIKKNGDIFDANITNEMWILEPCKVKFIGSIVVDKVKAKRRKKFVNNKEMNVMEYSYDWHWFHKIAKKERFHESVSIFNEMKKFPVEFDKDGNLIIYKCATNNIDFDEEIDNSVTLLETYRNTNNEEGMKYELAKMWFIIAELEKRMKKRNVPAEDYNKLVRQRSIAMNVFKTNFKYLSELDKNFNFAAYYNSTPFSNNGVKITNNTLKYSINMMKALAK